MSDKVIECEGFTFLANFDSANLARVEFVPKKLAVPAEQPVAKAKKISVVNNNANRSLSRKLKPVEFPDYEFNIWTNPDCAGTEFENCNRTWFYFGITGGTVYSLIKLNIIDLNKQSKMYNQGMAPVFRIVPGKCQWERVHDRPVYTSENNIFTLSFKFRTTENVRAVTYFAFTYPFSYTELQTYLSTIDSKMSLQENHLPKAEIKFNKGLKISNDLNDAIYYHKELLCYSLKNRNVYLITISSHHNITTEREPRLQGLFPIENSPRPFKFQDKKVIFISARVHPGETPSSFVMNGILNLLIQKDNPIAILLRRQFVFKLIPMLNPDGVALGHYRTDTRGCNLNRVYLNPSPEYHPSVYGARSVIRYHHFREEKEEELKYDKLDVSSQADPNEASLSEFSSRDQCPGFDWLKKTESYSSAGNCSDITLMEKTLVSMNLNQNNSGAQKSVSSTDVSLKTASTKGSFESLSKKDVFFTVNNSEDELMKEETKKSRDDGDSERKTGKAKPGEESGLFLYLDLHGHASKKGVFMYGNHFEKIEDSVECMLFPKIMSVNSQNFHFSACNFTEKNMYLRDKRDGTSREGSGRVAVYRLTGLIRSYTLECNYNTGRVVNKLPQCCRELPGKNNSNLIVPPKYSPVVYEEIGRSICISILDLTNSNPWSRIPNSEYHTLYGMRDWLRIRRLSDNFLYHRPVSKSIARSKTPNKSSQTQVMIGVLRSDVRPGKLLSNVLLAPLHSKQPINAEHNQGEMDRKENGTAFRGGSSSLLVTRKEAGPSQSKRTPNRVSSLLQVRGGGARPIKSLKKTIYRGGDKLQKFKQYVQKAEGSSDEPASEADSKGPGCDGERRLKKASASDQCFFKQSPKRLKISKGEEGTKSKGSDWSKEDATPGPSCSDMVLYSRLNRPGSGGDGLAKKRSKSKTKQQMPPLKFKKSLEKRRGSDASRKKSKTLFKKAGKIILTNLTNETSKNSLERKRRKN